ncbi:MAG: hypothetical protein U9O89_05235 [Thermoproteota archaeon]|nr:hypothetical protein [Thermoproteota archaeon]
MSKTRILLLTFLIILAIYVTLYTIVAYRVACHVTKLGNTTYWRTTASGSFFPWPKEPGMAEALSEMNSVNKFIYLRLLETRMLIVISILF